ncbi:ABC transporter ATP-binding protein [Streptomyces sp. NPDC087300]|uniref:ABC transporter ATP-binding protein n=1 Tax=Streptomyces sp. NPDC087300 TaxID=3365780 RepID=UPI003829D64E
MTAPILRARSLGKRYRKRWALADCTLDVPAGRIVGLVGPNGAGKSTLLKLASGMLAPTVGAIEVCGGTPGAGPAQLAKVGFVAQDTPTYPALTVADHLTLGARLNRAGWDTTLAEDRIRRLGLDPAATAGSLSGGQRAQLALTLGIAKRPDLLILDEPVAALDPLARREFLQDLTESVAEHETSVVLSSHLVSDVERVCDHVIVLTDSRVQVAGEIEELQAAHHRLTRPGAVTAPPDLPADCHIVTFERTDQQTTVLVRGDAAARTTSWSINRPSLEDIVLAYMRTGSRTAAPTPRPAALETSR